jgi:hypothetical protein
VSEFKLESNAGAPAPGKSAQPKAYATGKAKAAQAGA